MGCAILILYGLFFSAFLLSWSCSVAGIFRVAGDGPLNKTETCSCILYSVAYYIVIPVWQIAVFLLTACICKYIHNIYIVLVKFHIEDPQILGCTVQNLVATAMWPPEFVFSRFARYFERVFLNEFISSGEFRFINLLI
jgi:hypothetical protein